MSERLQGTTPKYPLNWIKTQVKAVEQGLVHKQIIIKQNTQWPNRVIVGLVKAAAVAGDFQLNPFKFSRFNLSSIELQLDGMGEGIVHSTADQPVRPYCKLASTLDKKIWVDTHLKLFLMREKCEQLLCLCLFCGSFTRRVPLVQRGDADSKASVFNSCYEQLAGIYLQIKWLSSSDWSTKDHSDGKFCAVKSSTLWITMTTRGTTCPQQYLVEQWLSLSLKGCFLFQLALFLW